MKTLKIFIVNLHLKKKMRNGMIYEKDYVIFIFDTYI